jgi:hypothetical protein
MLLMSRSATRRTQRIRALRRLIAYPTGRCIPSNTIHGFQTQGNAIADIEPDFLRLYEDMCVHNYRLGVGEKQIATNFNERGWSLVVHGASTDSSYTAADHCH